MDSFTIFGREVNVLSMLESIEGLAEVPQVYRGVGREPHLGQGHLLPWYHSYQKIPRMTILKESCFVWVLEAPKKMKFVSVSNFPDVLNKGRLISSQC